MRPSIVFKHWPPITIDANGESIKEEPPLKQDAGLHQEVHKLLGVEDKQAESIKKLIREVRSEELKNEGKNESAAHLLRHLLDLVAKVKSEGGEDKVKKEVE